MRGKWAVEEASTLSDRVGTKHTPLVPLKCSRWLAAAYHFCRFILKDVFTWPTDGGICLPVSGVKSEFIWPPLQKSNVPSIKCGESLVLNFNMNYWVTVTNPSRHNPLKLIYCLWAKLNIRLWTTFWKGISCFVGVVVQKPDSVNHYRLTTKHLVVIRIFGVIH